MTSLNLNNFAIAEPICWTVDLTPPTKYELEEQERSLTYIAEVFYSEFDRVAKAFNDFALLLHQKITIPNMAKNGNYIQVSHNKKIELPKRQFNSGPGWNPHARLGKGAKRRNR